MISSVSSRLLASSAWGVITLRGGIVALNFGVMIGLAASMGLAAFGQLAVIWGLAMIAATALSAGAPLLLLRRLSDGRGMSAKAIVFQMACLPLFLALLACCLLSIVFAPVAVLAVLLCGLTVNLLNCLASIMRALGSVQTLIALYEAGPFVALGLSGVIAPGSSAVKILLLAASFIFLLAVAATIWCVLQKGRTQVITKSDNTSGVAWSLWGTSLLGMGLAQIDIVVGGSILSPEQIGFYAVLRRLAILGALPVSVATCVSAGPISMAFATDNHVALRQASARGSQIALAPGLILFGAILLMLPLWDLAIGQELGAQGRVTLMMLSLGALVQVVFASGFTVATLCGHARHAAASRAISILIYLAMVAILGSGIGLFGHACIYATALTLGSIWLWFTLRQRLAIDTSIASLWRNGGAVWRPS